MDIKTQDVDGRHWDFETEMRNRAIRKIADETPFDLITSAMCSDANIMMNATRKWIGLAEMEKRMDRARMHQDFVCALHLIQHRGGTYFVHRHPRLERSSRETCIREVVRKTNAVFTNSDQPLCDLRQEMSGEAVSAKRNNPREQHAGDPGVNKQETRQDPSTCASALGHPNKMMRRIQKNSARSW